MGQRVHVTSGKDPCKNCPERAHWYGRGGGGERERWSCGGLQLEEKGAAGKIVEINRNQRGSSAPDPFFPPPSASPSSGQQARPLVPNQGGSAPGCPYIKQQGQIPIYMNPAAPSHHHQSCNPTHAGLGTSGTGHFFSSLCPQGFWPPPSSSSSVQRAPWEHDNPASAPGVELSLLDTFSPFTAIIFWVPIKPGRDTTLGKGDGAHATYLESTPPHLNSRSELPCTGAGAMWRCGSHPTAPKGGSSGMQRAVVLPELGALGAVGSGTAGIFIDAT